VENGFSHEALLYAGDEGFVAGNLCFIRAALEAEEPILVMVGARKIDLLREALDGDGDAVQFADMGQVGSNPARIIPAWSEFAGENAAPGRSLWGIGEPIWAGRSPAELVECQRHESLLNLAFADAPAFRLLCPYDVDALEPDVIEEAHCSHPVIVEDTGQRTSTSYRGIELSAAPFDAPLPDPPRTPDETEFDAGTLDRMRRFVTRLATKAGLTEARMHDLVLAVNEVATNSVRHAGGYGTVRFWENGKSVLCEVRDGGSFDIPLAGRQRPGDTQVGGHGLWLVNHLCDLAQIRSVPSGTIVRLHMRRG
jgi:anti-sigma regulatory factor (Ser/Thr protein kinase)